MKYISLLLVALVALANPLSAGFSEKRLESEKKSAAAKGKLMGFFFEQAYDQTKTNDQKHVIDVNSNNNAMKKAFPRKYVNVMTIDAGESRGLDKLPQCVQDAMKNAPQLIVTDAACEKVIAILDGRPDRKKANEFEVKCAKALEK